MTEEKKPYRIAGRPQTIYRVVKSAENPYVMIDRRPIDNPRLSYKAKGILTYLMSRPDGWEVSVADLINHTTEGEASVRSGMKELKQAGHVKYTKMREQGRITGWLIEVYEVPHSDILHVEKPHVEKPDVENRTQVVLNLNSTELNNNTTTTQPTKPNAWALYEENIGPLTPYIGETLQDLVSTYSEAWVLRAIKEAAEQNVRKIKYIGAVLAGYKDRGSPDIGRDKTKQAPARTPAPSSNADIIKRMAQDAAAARR